MLLEQHAKSVGYSIEVSVGLLKYWNGNVQSSWSTVGDCPDCNIVYRNNKNVSNKQLSKK